MKQKRKYEIIGAKPNYYRTSITVKLFQGGRGVQPLRSKTFNIYLDVFEDAEQVVKNALMKAFAGKRGEEK